MKKIEKNKNKIVSFALLKRELFSTEGRLERFYLSNPEIFSSQSFALLRQKKLISDFFIVQYYTKG